MLSVSTSEAHRKPLSFAGAPKQFKVTSSAPTYNELLKRDRDMGNVIDYAMGHPDMTPTMRLLLILVARHTVKFGKPFDAYAAGEVAGFGGINRKAALEGFRLDPVDHGEVNGFLGEQAHRQE